MQKPTKPEQAPDKGIPSVEAAQNSIWHTRAGTMDEA